MIPFIELGAWVALLMAAIWVWRIRRALSVLRLVAIMALAIGVLQLAGVLTVHWTVVDRLVRVGIETLRTVI